MKRTKAELQSVVDEAVTMLAEVDKMLQPFRKEKFDWSSPAAQVGLRNRLGRIYNKLTGHDVELEKDRDLIRAGEAFLGRLQGLNTERRSPKE